MRMHQLCTRRWAAVPPSFAGRLPGESGHVDRRLRSGVTTDARQKESPWCMHPMQNRLAIPPSSV